jgi:hypothetical protein
MVSTPPGLAPPVTVAPKADGTTVAIFVLRLVHTPVGVWSLSIVVAPLHILFIPVIATGWVLMDTPVATKQLPILYVTTALPPGKPEPGIEPHTKPPLTVATALLLLVQTPPGVISLILMHEWLHILSGPPIIALG